MRNVVQLIGRITKDPEFKVINGKDFASTSLAYNKSKENVFFIDLNFWEKIASKSMKYEKGELVLVSGDLDIQSWEKDGIRHTKTLINVRFIQPMSYKPTSDEVF